MSTSLGIPFSPLGLLLFFSILLDRGKETCLQALGYQKVAPSTIVHVTELLTKILPRLARCSKHKAALKMLDLTESRAMNTTLKCSKEFTFMWSLQFHEPSCGGGVCKYCAYPNSSHMTF